MVRAAAVRADGQLVADLIREVSVRARILESMAADPCLRSNPVRLEREAIDEFLDRVLEAAIEA